ncbi:MAG: YjjW family glycine radical enzyme activase [Atopobiaceae bacterium]|nr:YjjW family glycine radical enzyme activase [Atopobiaceae bacterium]
MMALADSLTAPVNKVIPFSLVDGPGSRCSIFLQGCNIACKYCHNPETQNLCVACGLCVEQCPAGALHKQGKQVMWNKDACVQCDTCIHVCPHKASPKIERLTPSEVFEVVHSYQPFIRGITVSGGECMLHPDWMRELFSLCRGAGLGTLIDSNGCVPFWEHEDLLEVADGVMLDIKAWDTDVFKRLTNGDASVVKRNLALLAEHDKIEELRIVVVPGWNDPEETIAGIASTLGSKIASTKLKLIRFRRFGVVGELADAESPTDERMVELEALACKAGFGTVELR